MYIHYHKFLFYSVAFLLVYFLKYRSLTVILGNYKDLKLEFTILISWHSDKNGLVSREWWLCSTGAVSGQEEIPHVQGERNPTSKVGSNGCRLLEQP